MWVPFLPHPDTPSAGGRGARSHASTPVCSAGQHLCRAGREESGIPPTTPSADTAPEGLHPPHAEPLLSRSGLSAQAGPGGGRLPHPSSLSPQAGCENPSISLHVIGLNGPTHDLEMAPPDDPRMRFASFLQLRSGSESRVRLCGLCGFRLPI